jgi:hypothetical protein
MKKVIRLTESELTNLIKRIITEAEMSHDMFEDDMMDGEMEEGFFGPSKSEREEMKQDLMNQMEELVGESEFTMDDMANTMDSILKKAKDTKYKGNVSIKMTSRGKPMFFWEPEYSRLQKMAMGTGSQTLGK